MRIGRLKSNYGQPGRPISIYDNGVWATIEKCGIQSKYISIRKNFDGFHSETFLDCD